MEPRDWEKAGFEARVTQQQRRAEIEAAHDGSTARGFIKSKEEERGVMGMDAAGIPTDYSEPTRQFNEEGVKATGHNKLSNAMLGIAVANILTAPERGIDMVTLPAHYARYVIEPIRFICENKLDFFQGNVVKYIVRHDAKNGIEDIDKVIRYAQMYKRFLMKDPDWWKAGKPEDLTNG